MRVFDFDNTIYDGESVLDFYLFSIRYHPGVLKYLFVVLFHFLRYKLGKTTMEELERGIKTYATGCVRSFSDLNAIVSAFWDKHMRKLKPWYHPQPDDVILTASFNVIIDEACRRLGVSRCICSMVNRQTMELERLNFSHNKRKIFEETFGDQGAVDEFYTDNLFDRPMIEIAKKAYIVKGNKVKRIK